MKYVRTKYDSCPDSYPIVYERDKPKYDESMILWDGTIAHISDEDIVRVGHPRCASFYMQRKYIIKETDNLEELCDYVWYKERYHEPKCERIRFDVVRAMKQPRIDGTLEYVRLIIVTDKYIKAVAEMNGTGGWLLL